MSTSAERTYEQQNDDALENLYSKVKSLVSNKTTVAMVKYRRSALEFMSMSMGL